MRIFFLQKEFVGGHIYPRGLRLGPSLIKFHPHKLGIKIIKELVFTTRKKRHFMTFDSLELKTSVKQLVQP